MRGGGQSKECLGNSITDHAGAGQVAGACRGSLKRMGVEQVAVGQLHWSAANYAPLQERALWDGLIRMHDEVRHVLSLPFLGKQPPEFLFPP